MKKKQNPLYKLHFHSSSPLDHKFFMVFTSFGYFDNLDFQVKLRGFLVFFIRTRFQKQSLNFRTDLPADTKLKKHTHSNLHNFIYKCTKK
jgi:hypothetical protein